MAEAPKAAAKAPAKKGEGSAIAKAPIRRLMKKEGADLVAAEALDKLIGYLEKIASAVTKKAIDLCNQDKRKRVTAVDIRNASRTA